MHLGTVWSAIPWPVAHRLGSGMLRLNEQAMLKTRPSEPLLPQRNPMQVHRFQGPMSKQMLASLRVQVLLRKCFGAETHA